ncbi:MAG: GDP-mannose 4,6-dehydratase [Sphingomonadales bacterium]|nr:GDP-mannose 4,6-dehydratase [Sphingomonadales bacterium]
MTILITGAAGFIGHGLAERLLARGDSVLGIDNMNDYYDPALKQARINDLSERFGDRFSFSRVDFADHQALDDVTCQGRHSRHRPSRRAGRCPLFNRKPSYLCPVKPCRPSEYA